MRVGLLIIATNRYISFVPPLMDSARQWFAPGGTVDFLVFTNQPTPQDVVRFEHAHKPWPMTTLHRFHAFWSHRSQLANYDYLYYCDADMRFVDQVGSEILGDLVAVQHPYFYNKPRGEFPYEANPRSTAYIAPTFGTQYFAGGLQGGRASCYLEAARTISENIDLDLRKGLIAKWHDESHWNHYLLNNKPSVVLDPSYCYPEGKDLPGYTPRLIALEKDHDYVRGVSMINRYGKLAARALRRIRRAFTG